MPVTPDGSPKPRRPDPRQAAQHRLPDLGGALLLTVPLAAIVVGVALWQVRAAGQPVRQLPWTVAEAAGLVAYTLCWLLSLVGLLVAHPRGARLVARLLPWHQWLGLFTLAFVSVHVIAVVADPYAGVGWLGVLVPGASRYRAIPVALGSLSAWSLLLVGVTARFAPRFGPRTWRRIHAWALVVFILAFVHATLTGSDTLWLHGYYAVTGVSVWVAAMARYWAIRPPQPAPSRVSATIGIGGTSLDRAPSADPGPGA